VARSSKDRLVERNQRLLRISLIVVRLLFRVLRLSVVDELVQSIDVNVAKRIREANARVGDLFIADPLT
jgi:hypothetical protein